LTNRSGFEITESSKGAMKLPRDKEMKMTTQEKNEMMAEYLEEVNEYLKGLSESLKSRLSFKELCFLNNQSKCIEEILRVGKEPQ